MWRAVRRVPEFLRASDEQMRRDQDLIRRKNLGTLKSVCLVYTLLLLAYSVTAFFLFDSIPLRVLYGIFVAAQLAFDIWLLSVRTSPPAYRRVQAMCTLLSLLIMGFVIAVSVFPYPDRPAIFFSPVLVGMAVIFLFSFRQLFLSLTLYALVFIVLAVLFKAPAALVYDIWAVIPAYIIALFCAVVVVKLRVSDSRSRARWMQLSVLDRPTGLLNKASCEELCRRFLCMEPDTRSAMLIVDMDHFKEINDSEGHLFGDKVLYGIGAILQNDLDEDTITGRIGGDEFLILVKHARERAAENLAGRLLSRLRQAHVSEAGAAVTCSIGIAYAEAGGKDYAALFEQADKALYQAKRGGGNRWAVYGR